MIILRLIALFWRPIAWVLGIGATYLKGRADARAKRKVQDLQSYADTRKAIDDADASISHDPGVLRDWLRARDPNTK